jgi:hypothetical protein
LLNSVLENIRIMFRIVKYTAALVPICAVAFSLAAHAVVIDFADIAENGPIGEGAIGGPNGLYSNPLNSAQGFPINNLVITANADNFAYLDAFSGGKRAGLGVCTVITAGGQCDPSNDDNISFGEEAMIALQGGGTFNWEVTEFRDADHNLPGSDKTLLVSVNFGVPIQTTFGAELGFIHEEITSITYAFGGSNASEFYIAKAGIIETEGDAVPAPSALIVFGPAVFGFAMVRRRRLRKDAELASTAEAEIAAA